MGTGRSSNSLEGLQRFEGNRSAKNQRQERRRLDQNNVFIVSAVVIVALAILIVTNFGGGKAQSGAAIQEIGSNSYVISITSIGDPVLDYPRTSNGGTPGLRTTFSLDGESAGTISMLPPENEHTFSDGSKVVWLSTAGKGGIRVFGTDFQLNGRKCSRNLEIHGELLTNSGSGNRARFDLIDTYTGQVFLSSETANSVDGNRIFFMGLPGYTIKLLPGTSEQNTATTPTGEVEPRGVLEFELTCS